MKKLVVIGIPIYKQKLTEFEKISLQQVNKILNKYPRVFIAPQSLQFQYGKDTENIFIERFPDEYFKSTQSYSQLMLSDEFYKRFTEYKFLLIYQLDAFVFSDQLEKFCAMDYDYIGAPWNHATKTRMCKSYVGNGGFSLRNIDATIHLLNVTQELRCSHELAAWWDRYEDHFFAFCGGEKIDGFTIAPSSIAVKFSFEGNVSRYYKRNKLNLPFGCHAWNRYDVVFYEPFIKGYGYILPKLKNDDGNEDQHNRVQMISKYLCQRYLKGEYRKKYFFIALKEKLGFEAEEYIVFGCGSDGVVYFQALNKENIHVKCFFDNSDMLEGHYIDKVIIRKPSLNYIKSSRTVVLVATSRYKKNIMKQLSDMGLIENQDFIDFVAMAEVVTREYLKDRAQYTDFI